jgi:hypothetical protein
VTYDEAVRNAAAIFAGAIINKNTTKEAADAAIYAMRVRMGNMHAQQIHVDVVDQVRRDILVCFGDGVGDRVRRGLAEKLGDQAAEIVDMHITRIIGDAIAGHSGKEERKP